MKSAILCAARAVFAEKGYGLSSVREIAERAQVYEPMVYRRYPTKGALFNAAVLDPINTMISDYLANWQERAKDHFPTVEERVRAFTIPLFRLFVEERELIVALLAAQFFHADELGDDVSFSTGIRLLLEKMLPHVEDQRRKLPLRHSRLETSTSLLLSFASILGLSLVKDAHFTGADGDDAALESLLLFTLYGIGASQDDTRASDVTLSGQSLEMLLNRVAEAERRAAVAEHRLIQAMEQPSS